MTNETPDPWAPIRGPLRTSLGDAISASLWDTPPGSFGESIWLSLGVSLRRAIRASLRDPLYDSLGVSLGRSLWGSLEGGP